MIVKTVSYLTVKLLVTFPFTGPYLFGAGLVTTLLSKEIWVVDHGFAEVIGFFGAVWLLTYKVGPKMAKWMDTRNDVSWIGCFLDGSAGLFSPSVFCVLLLLCFSDMLFEVDFL